MFSEALVVLAAASFFSSPAAGHMIMKSPTPFKINGSPVDNSPLSSGGNNFPCKATSPSSYDKSGISNPPMAIGATQKLSFTGSAVHGGGSCQLALTKDAAPTPSSSWQVILSIEGGCPGVQSPSEFDFTIPQGIAPGDYTFAWTWISKLAGQPEYYMNCAPITVTGGSSKRSDDYQNMTDIDLAARDGASFPQLFVANLQSINSCKTTPSTDPQFPNPGSNVQKPNPAASFAPISGTGCVPKGASDTGGSGGSSGSAPASSAAGSGGASPTSAAGSSSPSGASGSGSGSASSSAAGAAPSAGSGSGASGSGSGSGSAPTTAVSSSSIVATPISTPTQAISSAAASAPAASTPAAASTAAAAPPPTASGTSSGGGSTAGGLTGPCTTEGMWNCLGGSAFQRCASGSWSAVIPMGAGTTCTAGQSQDLAIAKREYEAPRFPGLRRHKEVLKNLNV